ncbi:HAD family hydrolase [Streptomyces sparsus]
MPALVVLDCFGTLVTELRPMPDAPELAHRLATGLGIPDRTANAVVDELFETFWKVFTDPSAEQPETRDLLTRVLRRHEVRAGPERLDAVMWHLLGPDDGRFALCRPAAEAMTEAAAAGHVVRLLTNCYLPGDQMRRLLRHLDVPDVLDACLFTSDGGPKKPDPRVFRHIGRGTFTRRVMVGDTPWNDTEPARALGWDTVLVDPAAPDFGPLRALLSR